MSGPATAQPTPALFFETANAYQRTAALKAAIELDVFTAIAEGNADTTAIATRIGASARGTRILCDYLTIVGFLTKNGGSYALTPDTKLFLNRKSPAYLGTALKFLNTPGLMSAFDDLAEVVRRGATVISEQGTLEPENPLWVEFARAMAPMMAVPAEAIAQIAGSGKPMKVLDIAAGHGRFGITIARHNPEAEIYAVDWRNVLEVAMENARHSGVASRYHTIAGSAFDVEFGSGYDLILLTNFLHHFDPDTCKTLLRKVHHALHAGGRAITLEFVPDENRISPPMAAGFSLTMLAGTPSGDAYTFAELEKLFHAAGFSASELHRLPASPESAIVSKK